MVDLRLALPNRPGALLQALDVIAQAGVSVEAACGDIRPGERWGYLHVLLDELEPANSALGKAGFEVLSTHDVEIREVGDQPGALAELIREFADAGRNLEVIYTSSRGVVLGTEDMLTERFGVKMGGPE